MLKRQRQCWNAFLMCLCSFVYILFMYISFPCWRWEEHHGYSNMGWGTDVLLTKHCCPCQVDPVLKKLQDRYRGPEPSDMVEMFEGEQFFAAFERGISIDMGMAVLGSFCSYLPPSCPALALDMFLLWLVLLHGIPLCLLLPHYSQQPVPGHWTCHILWSRNFSVYFSLWKCCLQTLISSHALVNLQRAIVRWVYFYDWSASAHFSSQVECFLLFCTDRPDCVDGRLSFIFYSHLKNMKEIYVTSPVDRKGQAVKGQVNNQLHWLLVSSFIMAFTILIIIISECWAWLFSYLLSLSLHFTD